MNDPTPSEPARVDPESDPPPEASARPEAWTPVRPLSQGGFGASRSTPFEGRDLSAEGHVKAITWALWGLAGLMVLGGLMLGLLGSAQAQVFALLRVSPEDMNYPAAWRWGSVLPVVLACLYPLKGLRDSGASARLVALPLFMVPMFLIAWSKIPPLATLCLSVWSGAYLHFALGQRLRGLAAWARWITLTLAVLGLGTCLSCLPSKPALYGALPPAVFLVVLLQPRIRKLFQEPYPTRAAVDERSPSALRSPVAWLLGAWLVGPVAYAMPSFLSLVGR
jgi:hypothetical protein